MINNIILAFAAIVATIHVLLSHKQLDKAQIVDIYFLYFLIFGVGIIGGIGFVGHVFFPGQMAQMIGWPTGSPFQFEVGFHDGAWALLGFLCFFIRGNFWAATAIGWSFFMLGAAYGHIQQLMMSGNYAPYNVGTILPDILVPVILITLLLLHYYYASRAY
jgi:hypothetical protein